MSYLLDFMNRSDNEMDNDTSSIKVGDIGNHDGILCKVAEKEGGMFIIETPHGTRIQIGLLWLAKSWRPLTEDEQKKYDDYLADSNRNQHP